MTENYTSLHDTEICANINAEAEKKWEKLKGECRGTDTGSGHGSFQCSARNVLMCRAESNGGGVKGEELENKDGTGLELWGCRNSPSV